MTVKVKEGTSTEINRKCNEQEYLSLRIVVK